MNIRLDFSIWLTGSVFVMGALFYTKSTMGQGIQIPIQNIYIQRHASTAQEGWLNGQSRVIQAQSQAVYLGSVAQINYQVAQMLRMQNAQRYRQLCIEAKIFEEARKEQQAKNRAAAGQVVPQQDPLTDDSLFDVDSVQVVWPLVLSTGYFRDLREAVDELISQSPSQNQAIWDQQRRELRALSLCILNRLKLQSNTISQQQYLEVRSFLASLVERFETNNGDMSTFASHWEK